MHGRIFNINSKLALDSMMSNGLRLKDRDKIYLVEPVNNYKFDVAKKMLKL